MYSFQYFAIGFAFVTFVSLLIILVWKGLMKKTTCKMCKASIYERFSVEIALPGPAKLKALLCRKCVGEIMHHENISIGYKTLDQTEVISIEGIGEKNVKQSNT